MPEPPASDARLQALRRRWEAERSTAFLPLAEEYRRLGRLREAIDVLELGLKSNPGYTSGLVALGRCRLESGDSQAAAEVLERVVAQDPEQLVASKLLIEAYLRTGRAREARSRLDIYAGLNTKDPEIARLRDRLAALAAAPVAEPAVREGEASAALEPAVLEPAPAVAESVFEPADEVASAEPWVAESADSISSSPGEDERRAAAPSPVPVVVPPAAPARLATAATVFVGLDGPAVVSRYLRGLAVEGIFPLAFPQPSGRLAEVLAAAPERVVAAPAGDHESPPAMVPESPPVVEAEAPPASEMAPIAQPEPEVSPFEAEVERAVSGFIPTLRAEAVLDEASQAATPVEEPPAPQSMAPASETVAPGAEAPPAAEATATLGDLYLRQGHPAEAERIFGAVLERDPSDDAARRGLGEAQEALRQPGGLSLRRAGALREYLRRLRGGTEHVS